MRIGDIARDFEAETTEGRIRFHDRIGNSWAVLFSHRKDFTPGCTKHGRRAHKLKPQGSTIRSLTTYDVAGLCSAEYSTGSC